MICSRCDGTGTIKGSGRCSECSGSGKILSREAKEARQALKEAHLQLMIAADKIESIDIEDAKTIGQIRRQVIDLLYGGLKSI